MILISCNGICFSIPARTLTHRHPILHRLVRFLTTLYQLLEYAYVMSTEVRGYTVNEKAAVAYSEALRRNEPRARHVTFRQNIQTLPSYVTSHTNHALSAAIFDVQCSKLSSTPLRNS